MDLRLFCVMLLLGLSLTTTNAWRRRRRRRRAPPPPPKGCSALPSPSLGSVKWNHLGHGAKATYSCYASHRISGVAIRTCNNGVWSGSTPSCVLACSRLFNPNNGKVYIRQTTARYSCNTGYKLIGSQIRHCIGQKWTSYAPYCSKLCPTNLASPTHGLVTISNNLATYTCFENYRIQGSAHRYCSRGTWIGHIPQCRLECIILSRIPNGKIKLVGNILFYECNSGYTLVGDSIRQCIKKAWTGKQPTCTKICPTDLDAPEHGSVSVSSKTATYTCIENYKIQGAATRHCSNGVWEGNTPQCVFECRTLSPPPNGKIDVVGPTAYYDCFSGYTLIGNHIRECVDRVWTGREPRCEKDCESLSHPANGYVSISGRTADFTCRQNYRLVGSSQLKCDREGIWHGQIPECILSCPVYPLANGKYKMYPPAIVYTCNDGFTLFGSTIRLCIDQKWNGNPAVCIPKFHAKTS